MGFNVSDANLSLTAALADGAAATSTAGFDLGHGAEGDHLADVELQIDAPALDATEAPDAKNIVYKVEHDTASDFSGVATLYENVITQTGAGGVGAAAATKTVRLPADVNRYVRVTATGDASGDATTASMTAALKF